MAFCTACRTSLPRQARDCPACGARRGGEDHGGAAAAVHVASLPAMESDLTITEVRLVTARRPREADGASGARVPTGRPSAADNDLAVCALVLGVVSAFFALLGQGWFGILAVVCGHQARRQVANRRARRVGSVLAVTGLILGCAAIVMMLASLVGDLPWS